MSDEEKLNDNELNEFEYISCLKNIYDRLENSIKQRHIIDILELQILKKWIFYALPKSVQQDIEIKSKGIKI
jgi:hypothetical protein